MGKTQWDAIGIFRIVSFFEGMSYILLLFVAVPIKYLMDNAVFVKALGMPHGILFVMYILLALFIRKRMKWVLARFISIESIYRVEKTIVKLDING